MNRYRHVNFLWDDAKASSLDAVGRLVYRSNLLGSDQRVTNTGGGNTSSKITERDPLTGAPTEVLWVKGSGGDLRTSTRENFASLYMEKLLGLRSRHVLAGIDVRAAHDLLRIERDAQAVPGDLAAAERHEAARLARADASPRGRPVHVVPEHLLDGTYDLAVGACYLRAKEFFGLRCHGDISPRVAITGQ